MLRLNVEELSRKVETFAAFQTAGKLRSARGILKARLPAAVGEFCRVEISGDFVPAEVIGFDGNDALIMPLGRVDGIEPDSLVVRMGRRLRVPVGWHLCGRVLDGIGAPIDGLGPLRSIGWRTLVNQVPTPLDRPPIDTAFITGQRVIDGLLTCGQGQRVGLFAGSGVGKSTLLGEVARGASSDVNVIALVGERGREVRPFLDQCLGPDGLKRSVVVVATSDESPLKRIRAAQTAVTIADHFRREHANVLLVFDSLTRLAHAQREIGLLMGEPPSARGYTPSCFQLMSNLLEQLGATNDGSITGILTVLVDGDDTEEPVADAARSILDGHIVLDRRLAEAGHYPAVNVGASISRVFTDVTDQTHQQNATKIRSALSTLDETRDLVRIGAYSRGSSPEIDAALDMEKAIGTFLKQLPNTHSSMDETRSSLGAIASRWSL